MNDDTAGDQADVAEEVETVAAGDVAGSTSPASADHDDGLDEWAEKQVAEDVAHQAKAKAALEKARKKNESWEPIVTSDNRGTRSFVLYRPVKVDGRLLTKVSIRPPRGGDLDDWGSGDVKSAREMLARLTGLHPAVIRGLDTIDLNAIYSTFWDMMPTWAREGMPHEGAG